MDGGQGRNRTADTRIFSPLLYRLSYLARALEYCVNPAWSQDSDPKQFRHYDPPAQEFFAAFGQDGIGTSGTPTTINSGDMAGILMIAAQTLEKRTAEQSEDIKKLKAEKAELNARLEKLERMIGSYAMKGE